MWPWARPITSCSSSANRVECDWPASCRARGGPQGEAFLRRVLNLGADHDGRAVAESGSAKRRRIHRRESRPVASSAAKRPGCRADAETVPGKSRRDRQAGQGTDRTDVGHDVRCDIDVPAPLLHDVHVAELRIKLDHRRQRLGVQTAIRRGIEHPHPFEGARPIQRPASRRAKLAQRLCIHTAVAASRAPCEWSAENRASSAANRVRMARCSPRPRQSYSRRRAACDSPPRPNTCTDPAPPRPAPCASRTTALSVAADGCRDSRRTGLTMHRRRE